MQLTPNEAGIKELLESDDVKKFERTIADVAAETTRQLVPSIDRENVKVVPTDAGVAVQVDSGYWHWWEFGNANVDARAPLRRGLEAAGLDAKGV